MPGLSASSSLPPGVVELGVLAEPVGPELPGVGVLAPPIGLEAPGAASPGNLISDRSLFPAIGWLEPAGVWPGGVDVPGAPEPAAGPLVGIPLEGVVGVELGGVCPIDGEGVPAGLLASPPIEGMAA